GGSSESRGTILGGSNGSGGGENTGGNQGFGPGGKIPEPPPEVFSEMYLHLPDYR
ncbi:hypothetical protein KI387_027144, partial [Taxus chinensis]